MAKVTSKLQVTVPKRLADKFGIKPGDDIVWEEGGDAIRLVPSISPRPTREERLRLFQAATARQKVLRERLQAVFERRRA